MGTFMSKRKPGRPQSQNLKELREFALGDPEPCQFLYGKVGNIRFAGRVNTARWVTTMLVHGLPSPGQVPVQTCGVIGCLNGHHWRWGTMVENAAARRKPNRVGVKNPNAKLTREQVIEIRSMGDMTGAKRRELAERYDVSIHTINAVIRGQTWAGVDGDEF